MVSVVLDDTDPSIQYSGNDWVVGGGPGEFMGTTHGTVASDSEIKIPFSGTAIQVYGTVTATGGAFPDPISTYSIDNGPATFFSLNSTGLTSNPTMMCFFNSPPLSDGNHTLNICSTVAGSRFWFDFAVYTVGPGSAASISTSTGATTSNSPGKLSVKPGQIVGGALGLFLMTVLLCSTIFYCYLRRKRHEQSSFHRQSSLLGSPKVYSIPGPTESSPAETIQSYVVQRPTRQISIKPVLALNIPPAYEV